MKFCEKCGNPLNEGAKFCPECGAAVQSHTTNKNEDITVADTDYTVTPNDTEEESYLCKEDIGVIIFFMAVCIVLVIGYRVMPIYMNGDVTAQDLQGIENSQSVIELTTEGTSDPEVINGVVQGDINGIFDCYKDNEIKAKNTYEGQLVHITGEVNSISETFGYPIVTIVSSDRSLVDLNKLDCRFTKEELDKLAEYKTGDTITFIGTCKGKLLNTVSFVDCTVVD